MVAGTHELVFDGGLLERGFWLYVWEITTPEGAHLCYVGRTGDSSSMNAQSPFNRMGQHLGFNDKSNPLRRYLGTEGIEPEKCSFRLVTHGPILEEAKIPSEHRERRDRIGAMEKALAAAMCRIELDTEMFADIRAAFAGRFPKLANGAF